MNKEVKAVARTIRIAPRKTRLIIDLIRGKDVSEARAILKNQPQRAARVIEKVLNSSVANAVNNNKFYHKSTQSATRFANLSPLSILIPRNISLYKKSFVKNWITVNHFVSFHFLYASGMHTAQGR